jgi:serine/threonine protein phosphatase PrpC
MQGWRCGQEDAHISEEIDLDNGKKGMLFSVFDGHGGKEVAIYAKERYVKCIKEKLGAHKAAGYGKVLAEALVMLDAEIKEKDYGADTGATACIVLVTDDEIVCANAGDSRGVLYTG